MATNNSVLKALRILEIISNHPDGISLSEIVQESKYAKTTVYDILKALYQEDAIFFKDRYSKTYVIGSRMFAIGQAYIKNSNFIQYSELFLKHHADRYGISCACGKRIENKLVYVHKYESSEAKIVTKDIGYHQLLDSCVGGLVFLSFLSDNERKKLNCTVDEKIIKKIREDGYYLDDGITNPHIYSYAVPVFNFENKIIGVLIAKALKDDDCNLKAQINDLLQIGLTVSKREGYRK